MGTQRKIFLVLFIYVLFSLLTGFIALRLYHNQEHLIISFNQQQLDVRAEAILRNQQEHVHQIIDDYTFWDEFVNFVHHPDTAWGRTNIASLLTSFNFESVWVTGLDGRQRYAASNQLVQFTEEIDFQPDILTKLNKNRFIEYFIFHDNKLLMIQGATIHPTSDPERLTEPQGYFMVMKILDSKVKEEMETLSGCNVYFNNSKPQPKNPNANDSIISIHPFKDFNSKEVAFAVFSCELSLISMLKTSWDQMQYLLVISIVGFLISLSILLSRMVSKPLQIVREIVEDEDVSKIPQLKKNSRDFERIGIVIEEFLKQKKELLEAMQLAKASDQIKTDFLNNISHEVRTPLNGILGASTLLADPTLDQETKVEMVGIMNESTQRLMRTITQYMDISLLSSNNMPFYPSEIQLDSFLEPILDEYKVSCNYKKIKWIVQFPREHPRVKLIADKTLFEKILHHLLDNAVKFTEHGLVKFGYKIHEKRLEFYVIDSGIGIDEKIRDRIFKTFIQEDSSNLRRYEGSGLGLAISLKTAHLLGGNITFESEKGIGTSFYLSLPFEGIHPETEAYEPESAKPQSDSQNKTILIAEDDDSNFFMLYAVLNKYFDVNILQAGNGAEAVEFCQKNTAPALILMDIKMPVMDGHEASRIIKNQFPSIPIIAVTAFGMTGDEQKALDAGCDDYVSKPVNNKILFPLIEKHMPSILHKN